MLELGDLQAAEECAQQALQTAREVGHKRTVADSLMSVGTVALCRRSWESAEAAFRQSAQIEQEIARPDLALSATLRIGRVYLARGEPEPAARLFEAALRQARSGSDEWWDAALLSEALSGLEASAVDDEQFTALCRRIREACSEARDIPLVQWYLEPTVAMTFPHRRDRDEFTAPVPLSNWRWQDPLDGGSCTGGHGLAMRAPNGRGLWNVNLSAPRLLRPARGDFALQTVCAGAVPEKPAIGGLLLWNDPANYLRLERGIHGEHDLSFGGCLGDNEMTIGRGRLPAERHFLRLERLGTRVHALCSADGEHWFTVGRTEFHVEDPVQVGLHAIGMIDRTIYPGAYPEGTAIRFEGFELWGNHGAYLAG